MHMRVFFFRPIRGNNKYNNKDNYFAWLPIRGPEFTKKKKFYNRANGWITAGTKKKLFFSSVGGQKKLRRYKGGLRSVVYICIGDHKEKREELWRKIQKIIYKKKKKSINSKNTKVRLRAKRSTCTLAYIIFVNNCEERSIKYYINI